MPGFDSKSVWCQRLGVLLCCTWCSYTETKLLTTVGSVLCTFQFSHVIHYRWIRWSKLQGTCEISETLCDFKGKCACISWEKTPRLYPVLQGIDDSKSLLATPLVCVVIALILTLVSAHRGGSWTTQHNKKWAVIHAHSFSSCQWWWWKVHPSLVLLLPLTCQAPWLGQVEQVQ